MSSSSFLAKARQHLAVGTSLLALLVNLGAPVPIRRSRTRSANCPANAHRIADQACHRDHRRKPYLRSRLRYLQAESRGDRLQPPLQGHHQRRRDSRAPISIWRANLPPSTPLPTTMSLNPPSNAAYEVLPPVLAGGYTTPPFPDVATAMAIRERPAQELITYTSPPGGTGLNHGDVDTRIPNATTLPSARSRSPPRLTLTMPTTTARPPLLSDVAAV